MPEAVQSLWVGSQLSRLERLCLASFVAAGHEVLLYTYEDVAGVPAGVRQLDANAILPAAEIFRHRSGSLALFADLFRWTLLRQSGGYWVDTDMVCLRPFDFDSALVFGHETDERINTAVLKIPAGHELCDIMIERCRRPNKFQACDDKRARRRKWKRLALFQGRDAAKWGELGGPIGFTLAVRQLGLWNTALPFTAFYALGPHNSSCLVDNTFRDSDGFFDQAYGIHLWTEMLRRESFDKDGPYPAGSLLDQLQQRFPA